MRRRAVLVSLIAALPAGLVAAVSLARAVPDFFDPCFQWATGSSTETEGMVTHTFSGALAPGGPCRSIRASSETKLHALARLTLVPGGILAAVTLAGFGAVRSRSMFSVLAALLILLESVPLIFSFAPVSVFACGGFLLAARYTTVLRGPAKALAQITGSLAAVAAFFCLRSVLFLGGAPPLLLALICLLILVAVIGWWPHPAGD